MALGLLQIGKCDDESIDAPVMVRAIGKDTSRTVCGAKRDRSDALKHPSSHMSASTVAHGHIWSLTQLESEGQHQWLPKR